MFDRIVSHKRALEAAHRLYKSNFGQPEKPRISIPAKADDDDVVLIDYIWQQMAKETTRMQPAGEANDRS